MVLYGRPVITMHSRLNVLHTSNAGPILYFEKNTTEVKVEACFQYYHQECTKIGKVPLLHHTRICTLTIL